MPPKGPWLGLALGADLADRPGSSSTAVLADRLGGFAISASSGHLGPCGFVLPLLGFG